MITLLERCISSQAQGHPRWADPSTVQVLAGTQGNAVVKISPLHVKGCHVKDTCPGLRCCLLLCRYQLVLVARGGNLLSKILETTDFEQLPHITLAFQPGDEVAVKQVCVKQAKTTWHARHPAAFCNLQLKASIFATIPGFSYVAGEEQL